MPRRPRTTVLQPGPEPSKKDDVCPCQHTAVAFRDPGRTGQKKTGPRRGGQQTTRSVASRRMEIQRSGKRKAASRPPLWMIRESDRAAGHSRGWIGPLLPAGLNCLSQLKEQGQRQLGESRNGMQRPSLGREHCLDRPDPAGEGVSFNRFLTGRRRAWMLGVGWRSAEPWAGWSAGPEEPAHR